MQLSMRPASISLSGRATGVRRPVSMARPVALARSAALDKAVQVRRKGEVGTAFVT